MGELFERTLPETALDWTGERLTSDKLGQVEIEHLHRYFLARALCRDVIVLDIASGEGYGAMLLAQVASSVVAVDVSADAVAFAQTHYVRPNLSFLRGDARSIPVPDASVDVVVSFETIEHFYEQEQFLREVKRVLRPGGRFIVSSPERDVYSPAGGPTNPYHVRELTRAEFATLLNTYFTHTLMLAQRPMLGSALIPESQEGSSSSLLTFERRDETHFEVSSGLPRPIYLVAVSSDAPIPGRMGSLYIETSALDGLFARLSEAEHRSQNLSESLARADAEIRGLQAALMRGEGQLSELRRQLDQSDEWSRSLREMQIHANNQDAEVAWLRAELQARTDERHLLLGSRSWKLTAPLRAITHDESAGRHTGSALKSVYRLLANREGRYNRTVASNVTAADLRSIPDHAQVLVAGAPNTRFPIDDRLTVRPFPQFDSGDYAGADPADNLAAIAHLEALRADGQEYFILPVDAGWWLSEYPAFHRHLLRHYRVVVDTRDAARIFSLRESPQPRVESAIGLVEDAFSELDARRTQGYAILDCGTNLELAQLFPQRTIFSPPENRTTLPYLDRSIDVVAVREPHSALMHEARRVATLAVVTFTDTPGICDSQVNARIEWMPDSQTPTLPRASIFVDGGASRLLAPRLESIANTLPAECSGELFVIAPPSDALGHELRRMKRDNLEVRRLESFEAATSASHCEILVFLGYDALPLQDWLPALLSTLCRFPNAAIVGGRVVDRNGRLTEAGGAISDSGTVRLIGAGHSQPDDPAYACLRVVDWCSRTIMATWRTTFQSAGGFDSSYRSSLIQDAEYCVRARTAGSQIYYQPESIAVQLRATNLPVDETDRAVFAERWANSTGLNDKP